MPALLDHHAATPAWSAWQVSVRCDAQMIPSRTCEHSDLSAAMYYTMIDCLAADIVPVLSQGMQQMLDETQADSANMRRMYVALGDRIADVMRSHCCRQAVGQPPADLRQVSASLPVHC